MKQELQQKLYDHFPQIFKNKLELQCEDGWFNLIHETCEKLQREHDIASDTEQPVATQIKEKFGTLRFYHDGWTKQTLKIVHDAEKQSSSICEKCGTSPAFLSGNYWLRTLCDACGKSYDN